MYEENDEHVKPREGGYILDPIKAQELETQDNTQFREEIQRKLDNSNKMYGNKGLQMNVQQNLSPPPEMHSSDYDSNDGLPPPIPTKKPPFILGIKLNVAGLGISTLAQGDGQTAEQMADSQVLKQSIQQKK